MELIDAVCITQDGWQGSEEAVYDEALAIVRARSKKVKASRMAQLLREQADQLEGIRREPDDEIARCPCCGSPASVRGGGTRNNVRLPYYVQCDLEIRCGMRTGSFDHLSSALTAWNRRCK